MGRITETHVAIVMITVGWRRQGWCRGWKVPRCFFCVLPKKSISKPHRHRKDIIQRESLGTDMRRVGTTGREHWTCDQQVMGSNPTRGKCCVTTLSPSSITWYWSRGSDALQLRRCGSNGSLPPGGWLIVTCGLTACTPGTAPGPVLGNGYRKPSPFYVFGTKVRWELSSLSFLL